MYAWQLVRWGALPPVFFSVVCWFYATGTFQDLVSRLIGLDYMDNHLWGYVTEAIFSQFTQWIFASTWKSDVSGEMGQLVEGLRLLNQADPCLRWHARKVVIDIGFFSLGLDLIYYRGGGLVVPFCGNSYSDSFLTYIIVFDIMCEMT